MSDNASDQQRQKDIGIVRQFKSENDARKRSAHGSSKNRTHTDQRPEARAFIGKEHRFETSEGAAHHQQRRQNAARSSRAQRYRPDKPLDDQHAENRPPAIDDPILQSFQKHLGGEVVESRRSK